MLGDSKVSPSQTGMCWASYESRTGMSTAPTLPLAISQLRDLNLCWSFTTSGHYFSLKALPMLDTSSLPNCLSNGLKQWLEPLHASSRHAQGWGFGESSSPGNAHCNMEIAVEQSEECIKFGSDRIKTSFYLFLYFNMAFQ